ncbi:MAG: response regulator [Microcoleaceae cyanobacterium]
MNPKPDIQQPDLPIPGTILVVDDLLDNLHLLNLILTQNGYKVRKARTGKMALMLTENVPIDLILLDINMPEMNGYEVCQALKNNPKTCQIPIIFISALDDEASKVKAFQTGGVDYVNKPFQVEEVLARVKNHLSIYQLQQQLIEKNAQLEKSEAKEKDKSQQLEEILKQFQTAQLQLVQSEKMSALGQLVAGIAHEINNPVSFISGNLYSAKEYAQDLLHILQLYQQIIPDPPDEIQATIDEIDLEFLQSDFLQLMDSMQVGSSRIKEIVTSLRSFSRLDEAEHKTIDIHDCLNDTLNLVHYHLQSQENLREIKVVKKYGKIDKFNGYPAELNQVFINIINNAIDALESERKINSVDSSYVPTITISTKVVAGNEDWAVILISDNGCGIEKEIQQKIFDPFFTTKQVGQGTGLGMSISYQIIVEKHQGKLSCFSNSSQGTTFVVEIPMTSSL